MEKWVLIWLILKPAGEDGLVKYDVYQSKTPVTYEQCVERMTLANSRFEFSGVNYQIFCTPEDQVNFELSQIKLVDYSSDILE